MINYIIKAIIFLFILTVLISCNTPPEDMQPINLLDWINNILPKMNAINLNEAKQKKFAEENIQNDIQLLQFYKDTTIAIHSKEEKKSDFLYSLANNTFLLKKPIYATFENNELCISFDTKTWMLLKMFSSDNDFIFDYKIDSIKNGNILDIYYTTAVSVKKELKYTISLKNEKPITKLEPDMTLVAKNKDTLSIDLNKTIVLIPADTIFAGFLKLTGNVFGTKENANAITITALRDLFIFINKKMLNISFNRKQWDLSLFSAKISPEVIIKTKDSKLLKFFLQIDLTYND